MGLSSSRPARTLKASPLGIYEALAYVAPVLLWAILLVSRIVYFVDHRDLLVLLTAIQLLVMMNMLAFRGRAKQADRSVRVLLVSWVGNFLPFTLVLNASDQHDISAAIAIELVAVILSIWAALSLRTSVSIAPGNRGVKTGGAYRWVRHPMYTSVILGQLGLLIQYPSAVNVTIFSISIAFKLLMIRNEERLLNGDPAYSQYRARVPMRFIPGVI